MNLLATDTTPAVNLTFPDRGSHQTAKGWIRGALYHGTGEFLNDIEIHLQKEFANHKGRSYEIEIHLLDFPTTAEIQIRKLLGVLRDAADKGIRVQVTWMYNAKSIKQKRIAQVLDDAFGKDKNNRPFLTVHENNG